MLNRMLRVRALALLSFALTHPALAAGPRSAGPGPQRLRVVADAAPPIYSPDALRAAVSAGQLPQRFTLRFQHDGLRRDALVHLPDGFALQNGTPVIYNLHGWTSSAKQQAWFTEMNRVASSRGAIAVHPQGTKDETGMRSWNAGGCCGGAARDGVDDVGFVAKLHEELISSLGVDKRGRFTGLSNGGFLSYRLARRLPADRIAKIAPVSGLDTDIGPRPEHVVPVMHTHGTSDPLVPFFFFVHNLLKGWPRDPHGSVRGWVKHYGAEKVGTKRDGWTLETTWKTPKGQEFVKRTVLGSGHFWPGGTKTTERIVDWLLQ